MQHITYIIISSNEGGGNHLLVEGGTCHNSHTMCTLLLGKYEQRHEEWTCDDKFYEDSERNLENKFKMSFKSFLFCPFFFGLFDLPNEAIKYRNVLGGWKEKVKKYASGINVHSFKGKPESKFSTTIKKKFMNFEIALHLNQNELTNGWLTW